MNVPPLFTNAPTCKVPGLLSTPVDSRVNVPLMVTVRLESANVSDPATVIEPGTVIDLLNVIVPPGSLEIVKLPEMEAAFSKITFRVLKLTVAPSNMGD